MKRINFFTSFIASGLLFTNPTHATELEPIVITASRTAQTVDETLASVTIIKRKDIERSQAQNLLEILKLESGVDLSRNGGPGQQTSLFLRGTNSNHTLVLIDGVRAASATTGSFAWTHMPVSQIERIEIVRGPRASLYGADAIGGVIQVFTRKPDGKSARLEAGSFGTQSIQAYIGGGDKVRFHINGESKQSDGFSAQNQTGFSYDPDDDGYDNQSISAGLTTTLSDSVRLDVQGWHSDGDADFDTGVIDSLNQTLSASISAFSSDSGTQTLRIGLAKDDLQTTSASPSEITTDRRMVDWQHDMNPGQASLLTVGLSHVHDEGKNVDNSTNAVVFDRAIEDNGIFINWQSNIAANDLQLGIRYDDHSNFGGETTGQLAWGRDISDKLRLLASYGNAFRSPTINELYHPGFGGFYAGNPKLSPETSQSLELALRYLSSPDSHFTISLYDTRIEDLIAFEGNNFQAININEARISGLEITHDASRGPWQYQTHITLQNARDEQTNNDLLLRPDRKLSLRVQRRIANNGRIGAEVLLSSNRIDFGNINLPGYGVVNLNAAYPMTNKLIIEGRVENLFDKEYELTSGFNTPELSGYIALRYLPD